MTLLQAKHEVSVSLTPKCNVFELIYLWTVNSAPIFAFEVFPSWLLDLSLVLFVLDIPLCIGNVFCCENCFGGPAFCRLRRKLPLIFTDWQESSDKMDFPQKMFLLGLLLFQNTFLALSIKASKNQEVQYINSTVVFLNRDLEVPRLRRPLLERTSGYCAQQPKQDRLFFQATHRSRQLAVCDSVFHLCNPEQHCIYCVGDDRCCLVSGNKKLATYLWTLNDLLGAGQFEDPDHRSFFCHHASKAAPQIAVDGTCTPGYGRGTCRDCSSIRAERRRKRKSNYNPLGGVALMMLFATLSGFAGVFMEKMFKKKAQMSFYMKSLLLYFWGSVVNGIGMYLKDG